MPTAGCARCAPARWCASSCCASSAIATPRGRYLVRYKGEGKLNFGFAAKVVSQRRGEMVLEVTPNDGGVYLWIDATNPANYLREIEILMPGGICEGDPFRHAASARDCGTKRFISFTEDRSLIFYPGIRRAAARLLGAALHGLDAHQLEPGGDLGAAHAADLQHLGRGARRAGGSDDRARQPGRARTPGSRCRTRATRLTRAALRRWSRKSSTRRSACTWSTRTRCGTRCSRSTRIFPSRRRRRD